MNRSACLGFLFLAALSVAAPLRAHDVAGYLRQRRQYHVDHATETRALNEISGTKVLELEGLVNGSFTVGPLTTLLLDNPDGNAQEIEADFVPDWLVNSGIPARLLVKAIRANESTPLRVVLLDAAKGEDIAKIDAAAEAKYAAAHPKKHVSSPSRLAIRGDGALFGPIGRGESRGGRAQNWSLPESEVTPLYAAYIRRANPRLSVGQAQVMAKNVVGRCIQYGIDARLVISIVLVESGFDPDSVSRSGAIGLGQLMPGTAAWMGVSDSFDVNQNIYGMVKLLRTLYTMFAPRSSSVNEAWEKTIAAYNAGDGAVRKYGGVPPYPETQAYVRHVLALYLHLSGQTDK